MTEREFETLVREHRSTIYTVCYMFSTDKDEVADLFQEILINLWRGSGTFRGDSALNSWIWKVALNTCITQDRKKKRGPRTEPLSMDIDLFDEQAEDTRQFGLLRQCAVRSAGCPDEGRTGQRHRRGRHAGLQGDSLCHGRAFHAAETRRQMGHRDGL